MGFLRSRACKGGAAFNTATERRLIARVFPVVQHGTLTELAGEYTDANLHQL
jgi:hypothetical protein